MPLGMELGLSPGDFVLDGDPAHLPKRGRSLSPKFSAHFYCGQTAGWMKMALGMEVGLNPGDFMLDGDPAPPQRGGGAPFPIFGKFLLWPNVCMHHDATWYGGRPQPRDFVFDGDPAPFSKKGTEPLPFFGPSLYCVQTAGWIKMAIGMEVGLGPGHIVLDGEPAPLP